MNQKTNNISYSVSPLLQKLFIVVSLLSYALGIGIIVYWVIKQYPDNHNLSAYLLISLQSLILPILMFVPAYLTAPSKLSTQSRVFDGLLYTVIGITIASLFSQLTVFPIINSAFTGDSYWDSILYQGLFLTLGLAIFYGLLFYCRKHKS